MALKEVSQNRKLILLSGIFLLLFFIPFKQPVVSGAVKEAVLMLYEYAREHVLLCLIPAFFIAGAITIFLDQQAVLKYLGPKAKRFTAYSVASISGAILSVCSCTVLPVFKGIYKKGAGLGPAVAFLYSGPAINILAVVLTAKVLGLKFGIARAVGAVLFSIIIGILMQRIYKKSDEDRVTDERLFQYDGEKTRRTFLQNSVYMIAMIGILVFVNWAPSNGVMPLWDFIYGNKFFITAGFLLILVYSLLKWFKKDEIVNWTAASRDFALQIVPLLFIGVLIAGFLLGRPGERGIIPSEWIVSLVGGNSPAANIIASIAGAFMYFATLTEIPIMQGLLGAGMGHGPALALLLAGPSLSLPSILIISGELGWRKTVTYVILVVILSSSAGFVFGMI